MRAFVDGKQGAVKAAPKTESAGQASRAGQPGGAWAGGPSGAQIARATANPRQLLPDDVLTLQRTIGNQAVLRLLQRQSLPTHPPVGPEGGTVDATVASRLQHTRQGGSSLPDGVRRTLEPKLGAALRRVKIHTGPDAVQLTRELGAKAFTHQNHIYYGQGQSPRDLKLTAHEAVHTIQQGAIRPETAQRTHDKSNAKTPVDAAAIWRTASVPVMQTTGLMVQRLSGAQETDLMGKMGRPKFLKAKAAGKLDFFFAKSDTELDTIRAMPHNDFDTMLASAGTAPAPPAPTSTTPPPAPTAPRGTLAALFEKVQHGALAFINSAKYAFSTEALLPKLVTGLTGKLAGEVTSESFKLELSGLQMPLGSLASTEFDLKMAAKLQDEEAEPTTLGERVAGLAGKASEGLELDDLADTTLGLKSEAETGVSCSASKAA